MAKKGREAVIVTAMEDFQTDLKMLAEFFDSWGNDAGRADWEVVHSFAQKMEHNAAKVAILKAI